MSLWRKENPQKINKPNQLTIFDKPLVLPEYNLKDGIVQDLIESKRPLNYELLQLWRVH